MTNQSIQSKKNKSPEWKHRKKQQHESNKALRASLESQKANAGNSEKRFQLQKQIDAIGAGSKSK